MNAELDEGLFRHTCFHGANMTGANLYGAVLYGARLTNTALYNTCFCEADLRAVQFFGAGFGATDICWAQLDETQFDTLSALDLGFANAASVKHSKFFDRTGMICTFSSAPYVLNGTDYLIIVFDRHLKIGSVVYPFNIWLSLTNSELVQCFGWEAASFMTSRRHLITELINIKRTAQNKIQAA